MGLSYSDLELFGRLRKIDKLGPVSTFDKVHGMQLFETEVLAEKIKRFFKFYGINRHKMTIITPSFYYDPESCDDNRYDMRPVMYATNWEYQFKVIDERVRQILSKKMRKPHGEKG
jgi:NAD+ synthase (glutamine-hydrolysing)